MTTTTATTATTTTTTITVRTAGGLEREIQSEYFRKSFKPMRWMTAQGIAAARRLPDMEIGETLTMERDYHHRHGLKRETITRIA